MATSPSPTATASASRKRRSRGGTLTLDEVKKLGTELLSSRAHLNHAPALLALLSPTAPLDLALEALISLQSFFVPLIPSIPSASAAATAGDVGSDPELVFGAWLRQRFDELVAALVELSVSPHSDEAIRDVALDALMDFVKLGKDGKFQSAIYHKFLYAVVHAADPIDMLLELLVSKYSKYTDIRYFTYTSLDKIANSLGSKITGPGKDALQNGSDESKNRSSIFIHNIYNLLAHFPLMDFQKESTVDMWSTVGLSSKGENDSSKDTSSYINKKLKLKFTKAWLSFLKLPLPLDVYKEVLASIHQNVIPSMSNPSILCDFLTRSYDIGGVISVMALSGLFILMTQHGLEYPKFYEKLYAVLTPAVFMAKHRSVFLQLLDTCLKSSYLPAYLAAAFAKRLSRLALSVPPAGALIIIALIHNLLRRHPSVTFLVHWEVDESDSNATREASQSKKIGADPFNQNEADPAKCGAMRSSLWEIDTLRHHYSSAVSRFVASLEEDLTVRAKTTEMKITDFSSGSYATVFRDEDEIIPHLDPSRVPSTVDPDTTNPMERTKTHPKRPVRISAWKLAKLDSDEAVKAAAKARASSSVLKPISTRNQYEADSDDLSSRGSVASADTRHHRRHPRSCGNSQHKPSYPPSRASADDIGLRPQTPSSFQSNNSRTPTPTAEHHPSKHFNPIY